MKRASMAPLLAALALTLATAGTAGAAKVTVHPLLTESTGEAGVAGNEISAVWVEDTGDGWEIAWELTAPMQLGNPWGFFVLFDTDRNARTGFPSGPLGVDYAVQIQDNTAGAAWVHRRINGDNTAAWSRWTSETIEGAWRQEGDQVRLRLPRAAFGVAGEEALRMRICHGSPFLDLNQGEWAPDGAFAYFTLGKDPFAMEHAENLCRNGSFERLMEAAATPLPQDWAVVCPADGLVRMHPEAADGARAVCLRAGAQEEAGLDSAVMQVRTAQLRFQYRCLDPGDGVPNLVVSLVGLDSPDGAEAARWTHAVPVEHMPGGAWHTGVLDVRTPPTGYCRVEIRAGAESFAEWLVDDVAVYAIPRGAQVHLAHAWSDKPLARTGEAIRFSTWVENGGDAPAVGLSLKLSLPEGLRAEVQPGPLPALEPGEYVRVDWELVADRPLRGEVRAALQDETGAVSETPAYTILVLDAAEPLDRQAVCTDERGFWRRLEPPVSLQAGNAEALTAVRHLRSSEIGHNLYGICTQVPRAKDYETPFDPMHLIDGDPATVWSSQQRPKTYAGDPPWVEIDLAEAAGIARVQLIPYWNNTDFPIGFRVLGKTDSGAWETVLHVRNHQLPRGGEMRGDKYVQAFPLEAPCHTRHLRFEFERLPLSGGNYAEVSQGYKARLGGIELIDGQGRNVALASLGATARASEFFTAWQSTAESIAPAFERIFDIGLKWVRIGQWGDQTEWAAIEREKGVFKTDPVTDAAIEKLAANGVDILYGLNYGNHHYSDDEIWLDIGPIYREGGPFNWNLAPSTPEQRQAFVRYVDFVVGRYKDYVKWWELWNEQNGWYPIHTGVISHQPELYGKLLNDVARHIKEVDPDLKVMYGGTAAPAPVSTEIALREGAAPYLDATAFHPYGAPAPERGLGTMESASDGTNLGKSREETGWENLEDVLEGVRAPFAQHGRPDVEVWINEFGTNVSGLGFSYDPGIGEFGCAKYIMRLYLYAAWLDTPTAWWALHNLNRSQDWGIIGIENHEFRPMSYALRNVCSVVSDVTPRRGLDARFDGDAPDLKVVAFDRTDRRETLVIPWAAGQVTDTITALPGGLSIRLEAKPEAVSITDLYWGVAQPAVWEWRDGQLLLPGIVLHDYPVVISIGRG